MNIDQVLTPRTFTKSEVMAAFEITVLVGQVIRESGSIPSGELYARLCDKLSLESYNSIIRTLANAKVVTSSNHLLTWIGPKA